jgi:multidrug efflux pump subunit AcrA (membrane-fusion protein)
MYTKLIALSLAAFGQVVAEAPQRSPGEIRAHDADADLDDAGALPRRTERGDYVLRADIRAEHDAVISAEVEGTLTKLSARDGSRVAEGQVIAAIDERQAKAAVDVADLTHKAALERATDKIEEIFAIASAKFAKIDLLKDQMANQGTAGAVTDIQIEQKKLALRRAELQIEKARKDRAIAQKEADAKGAELTAAQIAMDRRTIRAPFDGEVQEVIQKEAQWVNPGDAVLRLVQFNQLWVEGFVLARDVDPVEVAGRKVTVNVRLARDREANVTGRVIFVSQTVLDNAYQIRAEVQNQRDGEYWLIRPGLDAEMTIHLNEPPVDATPQSAALPRE